MVLSIHYYLQESASKILTIQVSLYSAPFIMDTMKASKKVGRSIYIYIYIYMAASAKVCSLAQVKSPREISPCERSAPREILPPRLRALSPAPSPRLAVSRALRESGQFFVSCIVFQHGVAAERFGWSGAFVGWFVCFACCC